jgi:hypothetical protein
MLQRKDEKALRSAITEYLQKLADSGSLPQSFEDPKRSMNRHQDVVRHGDALTSVSRLDDILDRGRYQCYGVQ